MMNKNKSLPSSTNNKQQNKQYEQPEIQNNDEHDREGTPEACDMLINTLIKKKKQEKVHQFNISDVKKKVQKEDPKLNLYMTQ